MNVLAKLRKLSVSSTSLAPFDTSITLLRGTVNALLEGTLKMACTQK